MDKRFFLALLLTGAVVIGTPILFPSREPAVPANTAATTTTATPPAPTGAADAPRTGEPPSIGAATDPSAVAAGSQVADTAVVPADTIALTNDVTTFHFSTRGASLVAAEMPKFRKLGGNEGHVSLTHGSEPMLSFRILAGGDTLRLDRTMFSATTDMVGGRPAVTFTGTLGEARTPVTIAYRLAPDSSYVADVTVRAEGLPQPAFLMTDLPTGFDSQEADKEEDRQHLAYAIKPVVSGAERIDFRKPDAGERILQPGPITWAVAKSKYFLVGVLAAEGATSPFAEVQVTGAPRVNGDAVRANATVIAPLTDAGVSFELYAGPQEWKQLVGMGRDFQNTNPYGGFANAVVQPFATIVMRVLLWMKATLQIEYGWILVIFGIVIRLAMWPLNTRMMRSSMQMQRIAPEVQAAQAKHKGDPEKQREAVMKIYSEAGVSPFAALSGCLPMLLPMPILFALFFVFRNTIEFRGVSFLWLADLSLKDPYYILPLAMGASMYALSKVGMRNVPPNPQTKMMAVLMPVIMTVALLNFASGLNLYYAVQNLAALPQQWLIANERAKLAPGKGGKDKGTAVATGGGARKKR
ncbi:MAG TPA: membrane protein insertase YidC [Gemmatimonadaceae bacterium]|nr:membrane protein insertase YidC [Gemmatimonadaceae bacterium]